MTLSRRTLLQVGASGIAVAALPSVLLAQAAPQPIVFVHGNGDTAGLWLTTFWRFESNGYPRDLLHAVDLKNPTAQSVDGTPMPGRSSTADVMRQLSEEVAALKKRTGAAKVILVANSRGGNTVRNYIKNGGGFEHVSLAVLCGAVNHGVVVSDKFLVGSEFNGASAFMRDLNGQPGEVTAGVRFVTIRSAENDKFAQPDGKFLGQPGVATGIGLDAPALAGAENFAIPKIDHRETAFSPEAFAAIYKAITGNVPKTMSVTPEATVVLNGKVSSFEAGSPTNIGVAGAKVSIFRVNEGDGVRVGEAVHQKTTGDDGLWGPFAAAPDARYEFVAEVPGQPITHLYRSPFPRSTNILHLRPQALAKGDAEAAGVVYMLRPRGYFGAGRDTIELGGVPAAGIAEGVPSVSSSKVVLTDAAAKTVIGKFNGETIAARTWPIAENRVSVIELTY